MSKVELLVPFLRKAEGGLSKDTYDEASLHPCPVAYFGEYGFHTSNGWTYQEWIEINGTTPDSITRWFNMSIPSMYEATNSDWTHLFKTYYWDRAKADDINYQPLANTIVDMIFNGGAAIKDIQGLVNVEADGIMGENTLKAINDAVEPTLYKLFQGARYNYYQDLAKEKESYAKELDGWIKRLHDLDNYNASLNLHI